MKRWWFVMVVAAAAVAEAVPPVVLTNVVVQKYGEERTLEVQPEGMLFIDEYGDLYMGNGETAGGVKVCAHVEIDWHVWQKDVEANGHAIKWNRYWKQLSEGGSLSFRYGTNTFLRLVGAESGTLANINVDYSQVGTGTRVISADNPDAVLQVSTNLMEAGAWQTATNAELTAQSDVSRTWTVTLMGTDAEFYRAIGEISVGRGIHAMRPLYAHQGIVDGDGAAITNWGDLTNSLSARIDAAIATNAAAIAAHATAIAANAENIYSNAAGLSWVTNALGQRISAWETVSLFIRPTTGSDAPIFLPTNLPTRSFEIYVNYNAWSGSTNRCRIHLVAGWNPQPGTHVKIIPHAGTATNTTLSIGIGTNLVQDLSFGTSDVSIGDWYWVPELNGWRHESKALSSVVGIKKTDGTLYMQGDAANFMPKTIEEWITWRNQQAW